MIKFEKITPGSVLLDIHSSRVGNTTMHELGCWKVRIISVDRENRTAQASWNGNTPETWSAGRLERLYLKPPKAYLRQIESKPYMTAPEGFLAPEAA